jgi:hypothetical protein
MPEDVDRLKRLRDDCNTHKGRIRKAIADGKLDVATELATTVLPLLTDSIELMMEIRDGYGESIQEMGEDVEDHEDRLEALESDAGSTILMPEDAETLQKIIDALRAIVEELLSKGGHSPEGEQKLRETLALCATGEAIIEHSRIPDEDDLPDEEEPDGEKPSSPGGEA